MTPPNNIHMLWLVPQGVVMSIGYVMFTIPGLEFAYAEAPSNMKAIIMAGWLLTVAGGNLVVVIIQAIITFEKAVGFKRRSHYKIVGAPYLCFSLILSSFMLD